MKSEIAKEMKKVRKFLKLTQSQFSNKLKISRNTLLKIEKGDKFQFKTLQKIVEYLGKDYFYLLDMYTNRKIGKKIEIDLSLVIDIDDHTNVEIKINKINLN